MKKSSFTSPHSLRYSLGSFHSPNDFLLTICFIVAVMVFALVVDSKVESTTRAENSHAQMVNIAKHLDAVPSQGWTTASAQKAGVFPSTMLVLSPQTSPATNVWGGPVTLESRAGNHETVLAFLNVPSGIDCLKLAVNVPAAWPTVLVNGNDVTKADVEGRAEACQKTDGANGVTVAFVHPNKTPNTPG